MKGKTSNSPLLGNMAEAFHILDVWRLHHPVEREFTFYVHPLNSVSRIDYSLGTETTLLYLDQLHIEDMVISDPSQISVLLNMNRMQGTARIWRFPCRLTDSEDFKAELRRGWENFVEFNAGSTEDPQLLWETAKAYLRGHTITYVAAHKNNIAKNYRECSDGLKTVQKELNRCASDETRKRWQTCRQAQNLTSGKRRRRLERVTET